MMKVALVGTASSGVAAPYDDDSWAIWGVSARPGYVTRANRWFEIHRLDGEPRAWANAWRETIRTFSADVELLMFYPEPDLGPTVTRYPSERIAARFGTYFMTSTFSWMMALAIDEMRPVGGEPVDGEIGLWGVEMEYGTEYREQRSGLRHFIDLARVMGIRVTRLAAGGLSYEPVPYPLWQDDPLLCSVDARKLAAEEKLATLNENIRMTRQLLAMDQALIEEIEAFGAGGYDAAARLEFLRKEHAALMESSSTTSRDIVFTEGSAAELARVRDYISP